MKQLLIIMSIAIMFGCNKSESDAIVLPKSLISEPPWLMIRGTIQSSQGDCKLKINNVELKEGKIAIITPDKSSFYVNFIKSTAMPETVVWWIRFEIGTGIEASGTVELTESVSKEIKVNWVM